MEPQESAGCLEVERRGDVVVARFPGEVILSGSDAEAAAERLTALLAEAGLQRLAVDFGNVRSLSSLMLGKLVGLNRAAVLVGVRLALFNLRPDVRELLELTRLNLLVGLYGDEAAALRGP
jgi:anti-sigma B factor antagonist